MNNTLSTMVIPKYQAYSEQLKNISPNTMEVKHVHQLLSEGTNLKIKALKLFQNAIAQNDEMLMNDGNKIMKMGKQKIQEAKMEADILIRR
ncbi:MAG: hypothetical protein CSYNP_03866 [Syntrophus sp. SKADARSKE-3]|nr:hypothetical protein [Syntrophus sp. SKADARSKE-3]